MRRSNEDIPQQSSENQQLAEVRSQGMGPTDASIRPGQFEIMTVSGAGFKQIEASSGNASSMPGAASKAPREEVVAPFEASFQDSIHAPDGSIYGTNEDSVNLKGTKTSSI